MTCIVCLFACHLSYQSPLFFPLSSIHFEQGHKALSCTSALLHSKTYRKLNDFDNHLDDISLDWSNQVINEEIDRCL